MRLVSILEMVKMEAHKRSMGLREFMYKHSDQLLELLQKQPIYVQHVKCVEIIQPASITHMGANQICFGAPMKTVAMHYLGKGSPIQFPTLPCIAIRRTTFHFDFFPIERCFYVNM